MEIWKDIANYEGIYQVSNYGRVRSLDRTIRRNDGIIYKRKGRIITPVLNSDKYLQIKLCRDGGYVTKRVHQLVANAFLAKPNMQAETLLEINHIDCNRQNNHASNLEWCTHASNVRYAIEQGNHVCTKNLHGKNNPNYGNHKLAAFYRENPDIAIKNLSRPREQNGRSTKVQLFDSNWNLIEIFEWLGGCAEYLQSHKFTNAKINTIRSHISIAAKKQTKYLNHYYKIA